MFDVKTNRCNLVYYQINYYYSNKWLMLSMNNSNDDSLIELKNNLHEIHSKIYNQIYILNSEERLYAPMRKCAHIIFL